MGLKVVALASGGKDSTYAMMKCVAHGHEVVALANLYPPATCGEEMDCASRRRPRAVLRAPLFTAAHV